MAKFRTQFDDRVPVIACKGDRMRKLYHARYDKEGVLEFVEDGVENIYESIQSHADSCDIHSILLRYRNGDASALSVKQGFFADVSNLPNSYAGILNLVKDAQSYFESLPIEERNKYDNSFSKWLTSFDLDNPNPVVTDDKPVVSNKNVDEKVVSVNES